MWTRLRTGLHPFATSHWPKQVSGSKQVHCLGSWVYLLMGDLWDHVTEDGVLEPVIWGHWCHQPSSGGALQASMLSRQMDHSFQAWVSHLRSDGSCAQECILNGWVLGAVPLYEKLQELYVSASKMRRSGTTWELSSNCKEQACGRNSLVLSSPNNFWRLILCQELC